MGLPHKSIVYPVYSRRAGGLSLGINLFPGDKNCPFNCPYCEVFPFLNNPVYSNDLMEEELRAAIGSAQKAGIPVKDICFSGNGEPTLSADFAEALKRAGLVRSELVPKAALVVISCGAGLLDERTFSLLKNAATGPLALDIWLKLDAGTPAWYAKMNRSKIPFEKLALKIKEFAACAPVTIQTMLCAVDGAGPPPEEENAWEKFMLELAAVSGTDGNGVRKVQLYGKARPAPEDPKCTALPEEYLKTRAESLRRTLITALPVEVYP